MMTYSEPEFLFYPQLESTNTELKHLISVKKLPEYSVVISADQTAGRGQTGNHWESEKNANLTFSLLLRPKLLAPHLQFYISKIVSLGIIDAIKKLTDIEAKIKWPNDIYINDKKVAGILIENSILGPQLDYCIVGIGLNVNQVNFTSDAPNPVSLKNISGTSYNLENTLKVVLEHIHLRYDQLQIHHSELINKNYMNSLYRNKGFFDFRDKQGLFNARIDKINEFGLMTLVDTKGKEREYAFKEVSFILSSKAND